MKRAVAVITLTLALGFSAFAQEPTYEQTQKWIVSKLSLEAGYKMSGFSNRTYEQVSMDECVLRFTSVEFVQLAPTLPNETRVSAISVPLNKVTSVKLEDHPDAKYGDRVFMDITAPKATKETFTVKDENEKVVSQESVTEDLSRVIFGKSPATDKDVASRLQKALNHAVDLCTKTPPKEVF